MYSDELRRSGVPTVSAPSRARGRLARPSILVLLAALAGTIVLVALAHVDAGGRVVLWENLHWNVSAMGAALAAGLAVREAEPRDRPVRLAVLVALGLWVVYTLGWSIQVASGAVAIPSPVDVVGLAVVVPGAFIFVRIVRGRLTPAEEASAYIDTALVATAIVAILLLLFGATAYEVGGAAALLAFSYPLLYLSMAAAGTVVFVAIGHPLAFRGGHALSVAAAILAFAFLGWVVPTAHGDADPERIFSDLFSIGILIAGYGAVTWEERTETRPRVLGAFTVASRAIGPVAAGVVLVLLLGEPASLHELETPIHAAVVVAGALFLLRQALLLRERSTMLAEVRGLHAENDRLVAALRAQLVERERVQDQLVAASRLAAVGELAAGVAHEVNNPLTGILLASELLLAEVEVDDPRRGDVEAIRAEALRARTIVRALRDFSRPHEPALAATDLVEVVTRTVDLVRHRAVRAGIVVTEVHAEMPPVELDPDAIQQALLNVLTNAMQAMPNGGTLHVASSVDGEHALVTIADDGMGMNESVAEQAFVPFFSGREGTGPGLGLSVSLGLIESHCGTIRLASTPDRGTTVEIRLPILPASRTRAAAEPPTLAESPA